MRAFKALPPAYATYRVVLIAVVLALLAVTALVVAGAFPEWWREVLSWAAHLRRAWTGLGWSAV
ncbi:hypothetical protein [Amycolatopsis rifamycinica]|uniref:Uncharacterized protein n=1 Tax=Amycolatopsis rifamycinica TaxID=287986 RepID=A0A066U4T9_9PSEU|nr:hypothetical protein [Amycolatopsis rifamycinica]KDN22110.1 hypothetical protein DV20_12060 [Amycolatopsis rifamycinica]